MKMKVKNLLCITFMFFLFSGLLFAKSKQKDDLQNQEIEQEEDLSLFEIDRLIRKTEYDEALRQLNIYIENNPDNFDNAQIRIRRIMNARMQYSILAEKLIDIILTDPNNNKEIYEITAQLEKFEKHPSDKNLQFIADLKKSAEFNYFRSLFMEIQTVSAELTQKQKYLDAIAKVQEGFWLYKDNFYEQWEENTELLATVDGILENINNQIAIFNDKAFLPAAQKSVDAFVNAVIRDSYSEAVALAQALPQSLSDFITARNALMNCGLQMQDLFEQLQQIDEDSSDASFLPFMYRFIFGVDTIPNSGIAGALNGIWNDYMSLMNNAVVMQLGNKYNAFLTSPSDYALPPVTQYASLQKNVLDVNNVLVGGNVEGVKEIYAKYYVTSDFITNLSAQTVRICSISTQVQNENAIQQKLLADIQSENTAGKAQLVANLFDSNEKIGNLVGVKTQQQLENLEWTSEYLENEYTEWELLEDYYTTVLDGIFDDSSKMLASSWSILSDYYKKSADDLCSNVQILNENTDKYFTGFYVKIPQNTHKEILRNPELAFTYVNTFETDENLNFGVYYSYPDIALQASLYTQNKISGYYDEITDYQTIFHENYSRHEQWKLDENITSLVNSTTEYLENDKNKLNSMRTTSIAYGDSAQEHIVAAQLAQNEADIRFAEAEAALSRDNFDQARKKLQDAVAKYNEALKNQDDSDLQTLVDDKLLSLGERITKGENEIVVKEVRQLKNQAKDAYLNGRFDDAEKYLTEAKTRWAVTNATEDSEIVNLMNFVNTALSMKTGRDILPSAPQYPEMSQLLNIANQYFESGTKKINSGDKEGGNADLDLALQNIQRVQYTYPLNRDASLLTLRINKVRNPQKFNEELSQKIDLAKLMCEKADDRQEGYANLLDYYDIEPNYKGLKDLIYDVEIKIGIRQKPVDNSGAKKAVTLFNEAKRLYQNAGGDPEKLQAALEKIDESIALQSDNNEALALKDKITIDIGGSASATLSTEDERLYRSAITKLQANDIFGANLIVQQLLKNPRNAKSQQIKDLKSKIDARL